MLLKFEGELYESYEEMLLAALRDRVIKPKNVFEEMEDMEPEDIVQVVMDYGEPEYICDCNLDYEVVGEQ